MRLGVSRREMNWAVVVAMLSESEIASLTASPLTPACIRGFASDGVMLPMATTGISMWFSWMYCIALL